MEASVRAAARGRRLFVPEVIHASAMDCGPAVVKSIAQGYGIHLSYGRLREACQTDIDGTSIDTVEDLLVQLGFQAEQVMVPVDHLQLAATKVSPSILVVRTQSGAAHFVVVWRRHGRWFQVMDSEVGRRWVPAKQLIDSSYIHQHVVGAAAWREWAGQAEFHAALVERMQLIGIGPPAAQSIIDRANADSGWAGYSSLDASLRAVAAFTEAGILSRGSQAQERLLATYALAMTDGVSVLPDSMWNVTSIDAKSGDSELVLRGAVMVRIGAHPEPTSTCASKERLTEELKVAIEPKPARPARTFLTLLLRGGALTPVATACAIVLSAAMLLIEALLFRSLLDDQWMSGTPLYRVAATGVGIIFLLLLAMFSIPILSNMLRLGRNLELRYRLIFLDKLPKVSDKYFNSRLLADLAERSHSIRHLRTVPDLGFRYVGSLAYLVLLTAGIAYLDPGAAMPAALLFIAAIVLPALAQRVHSERDLTVRTHTGALSQVYLDSLRGLLPIRAHGAERALLRLHETRLTGWVGASLRLLRTVVIGEAAVASVMFGLAVWLVVGHVLRTGISGGTLLLVYWALTMPDVGEQLGVIVRRYPMVRSILLRLAEPLSAPEEVGADERQGASRSVHGPATLRMTGVQVVAGGHVILDDVNLSIEAGMHAAIVGASGSGKSTLVGICLGWHRPSKGTVEVDGKALDDQGIRTLRSETAWIDPSIQIWNRTLLDNLHYGADGSPVTPDVQIERAELKSLLKSLPHGLRTSLGENGAFVSGGEAQRIRIARAFNRSNARLVIVDEAFRGLDTDQRLRLISAVRDCWANATLLFVTHDIGATKRFDQIIVVSNGTIVEQGNPHALLKSPDTHYSRLMGAGETLQDKVFRHSRWRRLVLENGRIAGES